MRWTSRHLDQLGHVSRGRSRHRPRDAAHLYGGPFPFIQTGDVKHAGLYITEYRQTYSEAGLAQSKLWPAGTLCITIAANIADTAILGIDACFPDSVIGFISDPTEADARFVKYLFDATIQERVKQFTQGAAQDNLSQEKLLSLEFLVPKVEEQQRIASILSTYDDLIENNRRRMALLEDAARQVYQEWFVLLRFPGREHTRIVDGVPEGWERLPLESALVLQRGFDLPSQSRLEGAVPIYASTGVNGYHNVAKVKAPGIVTGRSGSLGMVHYVHEDFWPLNTALWVKEFRRVSPLFGFFMLSSLRLDQYNGGVSVPTLDRKVVHKIEVVVPNGKIQALFSDYVLPMFSQIRRLGIYNNKLRTARDLLLPKLMSGEISV
ncbi:MAG: restriction endonuclease subunit S [Desulfuromonadaceae bacterium]|nr:restriction endonuclease subunit S [Desulfuromonadaceae bacterium]MDD2849649.1 restriction endonuclease subunit S [Desulfuromonadaceae bacterium]MDD4131679.1 restriction endonuclease subunit S [Desulfuromonadaceae bacterium]